MIDWSPGTRQSDITPDKVRIPALQPKKVSRIKIQYTRSAFLGLGRKADFDEIIMPKTTTHNTKEHISSIILDVPMDHLKSKIRFWIDISPGPFEPWCFQPGVKICKSPPRNKESGKKVFLELLGRNIAIRILWIGEFEGPSFAGAPGGLAEWGLCKLADSCSRNDWLNDLLIDWLNDWMNDCRWWLEVAENGRRMEAFWKDLNKGKISRPGAGCLKQAAFDLAQVDTSWYK